MKKAFACNLIIPGFPKSGTSSLHEYLDLHPDICMSRPKETHFFAIEEIWEKGVDFHNSIFADGLQSSMYFGESSTIYCIHEKSVERIKASLQDVKIILLLRNPVERVISHFSWLSRLGLENRNIIEAVSESGDDFDPERSLNGNCNYMGYRMFSAYCKYVPIWQKTFGYDNVKLIETSALKSSPGDVLSDVFRFLKLKEYAVDQPIAKNVTRNITATTPKWWAGIAHTITPSVVRQYAKGNGPLLQFWKSRAFEQKEFRVPEVTKADREFLETLLEQDAEFFHQTFPGAQ